MAKWITHLSLDFHPSVPLTVAFDAPPISSDGGVLGLRPMEDRLGLRERVAALRPEERDPRKVNHGRREHLGERRYPMAWG
jgi:hypothetical protein